MCKATFKSQRRHNTINKGTGQQQNTRGGRKMGDREVQRCARIAKQQKTDTHQRQLPSFMWLLGQRVHVAKCRCVHNHGHARNHAGMKLSCLNACKQFSLWQHRLQPAAAALLRLVKGRPAIKWLLASMYDELFTHDIQSTKLHGLTMQACCSSLAVLRAWQCINPTECHDPDGPHI